ncbi:uncharacterized protein LOC109788310 [Cajanus cajan]|uniref:Zinc finger PHD-type domain-containing protein n=1 Tax=Cajanus cajan TaxID=3821 RepID=A0A151RBY8_CAJCA|nr:uncharacterized protein LOC109788310 [Cajanus cajan]KYP40003.1 hypothetical protein KK1_038680 [Cajanus cajan]
MNPPQAKPSDTMKGECGNCRLKERWLFHRLSIRGIDRRLCTSCVLRLHPSFFCPSCFHFFDHPPSAHRFVTCTKCSSFTHLDCLPSPPPTTFLCPPCSNPAFSFFPDANTPIDQRLALVLLCASKVAAASAAKALALASARADRALREAALARKRARDALDYCSLLDKVKRLDVSQDRNLATAPNAASKKDEFNRFAAGQVKVMAPSEETPLHRPNDPQVRDSRTEWPG